MVSLESLPDEVLNLILESLPRDPIRQAIVFLSICKRLTSLFEQILYRDVVIGSGTATNAIPLTSFSEILQRKSYLSAYIRSITFLLHIIDSCDELYISFILSSCLALQHVSLPFGPEDHVSNLISKLSRSKLRSAEFHQVQLPDIFSRFVTSNLAELKISQRRWIANPTWAIADPNFSLWSIRPGLQPRVGALRILHLVRVHVPLQILSQFLQWPAALEELYIVGLSFSMLREQYTPSTIQQLLEIHGRSLKRVRVGTLMHKPIPDRSSHSIVDVSSFPELHSITFSARGLFYQDPKFVAKLINNPRLREINFRFSVDTSSNYTSNQYFNALTWGWLEQFVSTLDKLRHVQERNHELSHESVDLSSLTICLALSHFTAVNHRTYATAAGVGKQHKLFMNELRQFNPVRGISLTFKEPPSICHKCAELNIAFCSDACVGDENNNRTIFGYEMAG